MTVAELIEALKAMPQSLPVVVSGFLGSADEVEQVLRRDVVLHADGKAELFATDTMREKVPGERVAAAVHVSAKPYQQGKGR